MTKLRIRHLTTRPAPGGGARYYWQPSAALREAGFQLTRLPAGQAEAIAKAEEFNRQVDAWRAAGALPGRLKIRRAGSVGALVALYRRSGELAGLGIRTRVEYERYLARLEAAIGASPAGSITPAGAGELHAQAEASHGPAAAAAFCRVARLLFAFGERADYFVGQAWRNPFERMGLKRARVLDRQAGAERELWDPDDVKAFIATADRLGQHAIGTAVALNAWCGQRLGDILRLAIGDYRAGAFHVCQGKTGVRVVLDVGSVPELKARVAGELARRQARGVTGEAFLVSELTGRPFDLASFRGAFELVREEAARIRPRVAGLWFMRLRHTAVVRMAEADADLLAIAAVTGHSPRSVAAIIEHYAVRTGALARLGFAKRLAAQPGGREASALPASSQAVLAAVS